MMATDTVRLTCPACGKEISVPRDLETFSCLYCGAKHRMADLLPPAAPADEADWAYVEAHLLDCVLNYPDWYKRFNRKAYEPSFQTHLEGIRETYAAMDRYVCARPRDRETLLADFAEDFLTQWEACHAQTKGSRAARDRRAFSDKLTLAWYTVPAIRSLGLSVSEDFPRILRDRFNARYPDNPFELGTYEEIQGGFRKHGFCFVTTAVCEAEGKADDCPELTAFRAFRDGWLSRTGEGRAQIARYYDLAPAVVAAMRYGDREADRCAELRRAYLEPCYAALQGGDPAGCREIYVAMMNDLTARYGLET